ncbi:MAG: nitrophenyl compound nitroreductase subunit ArsF family protein [bacterium]
MSIKNSITIVLIVFVIVSLGTAVLKGSRSGKPIPADDNNKSIPVDPSDTNGKTDESYDDIAPTDLASKNLLPDRLLVYYFHRTLRCTGCINIENAAYDAIAIDHAEDVAKGIIEWRSIDYDLPENEQFIKKYGLYSQELAFVEIRSGSEVKSENIADVWQYWADRDKARDVISELLDKWLEEIKQG